MTPLQIRGLVKVHGGLRPLRIRELVVQPGELVSVSGLDLPAAEVLIHLVTGAVLPDEGEIRVFGQNTREIADVQAWLTSLDTLGVFSPRAVLIDPLTVRQNLAMPFTLDVDPIPLDVWAKVDALARSVGLDESEWDRPLGATGAAVQARVRLGRAIALQPALVLAEHPSAGLPREEAPALGAALRDIARDRRCAVVALTGDPAFAGPLGGRALTLNAATGDLSEAGGLFSKVKAMFK